MIMGFEMTIWHFILVAVALTHFTLYACEIAKMGFMPWLRRSMRQSSFQHVGSYFSGPMRIIVPTLELLLIAVCIYEIRFRVIN
jgi:hypothetical protein